MVRLEIDKSFIAETSEEESFALRDAKSLSTFPIARLL